MSARIRLLLRIICTPSCWTRNYPTSRALTEFIVDSINSGAKPVRECGFISNLRGVRLWTENYPYAYGQPILDCGWLEVLPSRAAVFLLADSFGDESDPGEEEMRRALANCEPIA